MDYAGHNARMIARFIWLESLDPAYAMATLDAYRRDPHSPNPNILADIKAEKARLKEIASDHAQTSVPHQR